MAWIAHAMLILGVAITATSVMGMWRFPDVYLRYKAVAMTGGLAAILIHVATALMVPFEHGARGFLTALLFLLSGPLLGQAVLSTAHALNEDKTHKVDDLADAAARGETTSGD